MEMLDPDVVGEVDLGTAGSRPVLVGRRRVGRAVLRFFGGSTGATLVSHPLNGALGVLAFRDGALAAIIVLETAGSTISDIHSIADPRKLALASMQLGPAR
jgi:hypothetical protein